MINERCRVAWWWGLDSHDDLDECHPGKDGIYEDVDEEGWDVLTSNCHQDDRWWWWWDDRNWWRRHEVWGCTWRHVARIEAIGQVVIGWGERWWWLADVRWRGCWWAYDRGSWGCLGWRAFLRSGSPGHSPQEDDGTMNWIRIVRFPGGAVSGPLTVHGDWLSDGSSPKHIHRPRWQLTLADTATAPGLPRWPVPGRVVDHLQRYQVGAANV